MPQQRARKYRLIASEIRTAARAVSMEESRTSLLNLASAYERMANAADGTLNDSAEERHQPVVPAFRPKLSTSHS